VTHTLCIIVLNISQFQYILAIFYQALGNRYNINRIISLDIAHIADINGQYSWILILKTIETEILNHVLYLAGII